MCLAGAGLLHKRWLGGRFEPFYCDDKYFCHWIQQRPLIILKTVTLPNGSLVIYEICSLSQVLTPWITSWGFVVNVIFYFNLRVIPYYLTICWKCLNSTVWVQTLIGAACLIDKHNHCGGRRVTPTELRFTRVWQIPVWKSESPSHSSL